MISLKYLLSPSKLYQFLNEFSSSCSIVSFIKLSDDCFLEYIKYVFLIFSSNICSLSKDVFLYLYLQKGCLVL
uniref:Uncharacterized protein n=1 Tax=Symphyocladiella dendroidea TaxID=2506487 RepID=A0A1Z1M803_9FLOR|nr:hypothetical protein [Symphyocladiella dendroidea]ARW61961.1 hypothetical protein [Symphyocladiella dendroidea]